MTTTPSPSPLRLLIAGAAGRTGGAVLNAAVSGPRAQEMTVAGVLSGRKSPRTLEGALDIPVATTMDDAPGAAVLIDFTTPEATATLARGAAARQMAMVTGTTGLDGTQQAAVRDAAKAIPIVQSGNMALGVNALLALVEKASKILNEFDIEITETHHRAKVDAPSGTALMLGEAAARGRDSALTERAVFTRYGQAGPRTDAEIGFAVTRGGGVFGDHAVHFLADGETVTLSHRALSRDLFAAGALAAARWVVGKPAGLYAMRDVLGLD